MKKNVEDPHAVATVSLYPQQHAGYRWFALWYFTVLMIAWNLVGNLYLGFEQSWAQPLAAVAAACFTQFLLEFVDAKSKGRPPRYSGGFLPFINLFPPAIISGFACSMLLYPNERIMPVVFAAVLAIASKVLIRVRLPNGKMHHVFNPSNIAIVVTLFLLAHDVGMTPPYQFTENLTGFWHWALPAIIMGTGLIIHGYATGRVPLFLAWIGGFVLQGVLRAWLSGNPWFVPLMPMSSAAFIVFTLYMVPDPATTPLGFWRQIAFGLAVAVFYGWLQVMHVVFGLFIALAVICAIRGASIAVYSAYLRRKEQTTPAMAGAGGMAVAT